MVGLAWESAELPEGCHTRKLTTFLANEECHNSKKLPIEFAEDEILDALARNRITAIKATTASGKTMKLPDYLFRTCNWNSWKTRPVLLVQRAVYAAEQVVEGLVGTQGWHRDNIQLRTGKHKLNRFGARTQVTVTTYGLLWEWLTADADGHESLSRYQGVTSSLQIPFFALLH